MDYAGGEDKKPAMIEPEGEEKLAMVESEEEEDSSELDFNLE